MMQKHIFVALTGASGSMYGLRLAEQLCLNGVQVTFTRQLQRHDRLPGRDRP